MALVVVVSPKFKLWAPVALGAAGVAVSKGGSFNSCGFAGLELKSFDANINAFLSQMEEKVEVCFVVVCWLAFSMPLCAPQTFH